MDERRIDIDEALSALDHMDDFARMANVDPIGPRNILLTFTEQVRNDRAAQAPAASAEPSDTNILAEWAFIPNSGDMRVDLVAFARALLSRYGRPAGNAQPVAWVAADTLNSPHPTCVSSLAYMSQIDRERGREYVPLAIIDRYAAPSSAQPAVNGYTCTVPDDCETLHWRGQILSMNELASVAQPGVGEEIHVHIEGQDVLTLPLASSGMDAPRFVVHVPAQAQQPVSGADGLPDSVIEAIARAHGTGGWQSLSDMVRFGRALLTHLSAQPHPTQHNDGGAVYD